MRYARLLLLLVLFGINQVYAINSLLNIPPKYESNLSVLVINAKTNQVIYNHNESTSRLIASNMKLFTSVFGLYTLKPDFKWHTQLFYQGTITQGNLNGNLYIKGGGDPTLDDNGLNKILKSLKQLGIKQINGNIVIDDKIFNSEPSFSELERLPYDVDLIPPYALMVNENISKFTLNIRKNKISVSSNLYGYSIKNQFYIDKNRTECSHFSHGIVVTLDNKTISLKGAIPKACDNVDLIYYLIPNKTYVVMAIQRILNNLKIHLNGTYTYDSIPKDATMSFDYASDSLQQIIIKMNHYSDNLIAETIFLSAGAYTTSNIDTYKQSLELFNNFLKSNNLFQGVTIENGSGVSRVERFSNQNIINLFGFIESLPMQKMIEISLPSPGESGTLETNFLSYKKQLFAKTGTLNDTLAYSGYFYSHLNNKYIISIIFNNIDATNKAEVDEIRNLVLSILAQIDSVNKVH